MRVYVCGVRSRLGGGLRDEVKLICNCPAWIRQNRSQVPSVLVISIISPTQTGISRTASSPYSDLRTAGPCSLVGQDICMISLLATGFTSFSVRAGASYGYPRIIPAVHIGLQLLPAGFSWAETNEDYDVSPELVAESVAEPVAEPSAEPVAEPVAERVAHSHTTTDDASENLAVPATSPSDSPTDHTDQLAALGCDAETWRQIRNKKGMLKLASTDEEHFRKRLAKLKELIKAAPPREEKISAPKVEEKAKKSKPRKRWGNSRRAKAMQIPGFQSERRTSGKYVLYGICPDHMDAEAISVLVEKRAAAKDVKDYEQADSIREELKAMNVRVRDDFRTWSVIS